MPDESIPVWAQEIRERVVRIETKLDNYTDIREAAADARRLGESNCKEIAEIKGLLSWLWRACAGAIIGGIVAAYMGLRGGS